MKVSVNGIEVELFYGAKLKHALLKADEKFYYSVVKHGATIRDHEGNRVDIQGAIDEGFGYEVASVYERNRS
ncbi:hypothetical protein [Alteribacter aurantiacus]|uniref:hypothetical protein n=1 Tax=Alteribacter aurantiacus TaxID=254410 RepID=UPI00041EB842|nr:hypothetical protein [Alteribacter aurantiacus]